MTNQLAHSLLSSLPERNPLQPRDMRLTHTEPLGNCPMSSLRKLDREANVIGDLPMKFRMLCGGDQLQMVKSDTRLVVAKMVEMGSFRLGAVGLFPAEAHDPSTEFLSTKTYGIPAINFSSPQPTGRGVSRVDNDVTISVRAVIVTFRVVRKVTLALASFGSRVTNDSRLLAASAVTFSSRVIHGTASLREVTLGGRSVQALRPHHIAAGVI